MADLLTTYQPTRAFRSSDAGILTVPKETHKTSGETAFSYYATSDMQALLKFLKIIWRPSFIFIQARV